MSESKSWMHHQLLNKISGQNMQKKKKILDKICNAIFACKSFCCSASKQICKVVKTPGRGVLAGFLVNSGKGSFILNWRLLRLVFFNLNCYGVHDVPQTSPPPWMHLPFNLVGQTTKTKTKTSLCFVLFRFVWNIDQ